MYYKTLITFFKHVRQCKTHSQLSCHHLNFATTAKVAGDLDDIQVLLRRDRALSHDEREGFS